MNVSNFRSNVTGRGSRGLAKQNKFEAFIFFPNKLRTRLNIDSARAHFEQRYRIDSFEFPGRTVQSFNYKPHGYGLIKKFGYDTLYTDVTCSMLVGNDLAERSLMTDWQDLIIGDHKKSDNTADGAYVGYYDDYVGRINITQFDESGKPTYRVLLEEAFPISVNAMPLSWAAEDVHRLTVQFAYRYFKEFNLSGRLFDPVALLNSGVQQAIGKLSDKLTAKIGNERVRGVLNKTIKKNIPNIKLF